jgi:hypothetical protein
VVPHDQRIRPGDRKSGREVSMKMTGVSLERTAVFSKGDIVMRRPPPFKTSIHTADYEEMGLITNATPMKKPGVHGYQTIYDAQNIEILWGLSGEIENRTTVFNNLYLVDPTTGIPENIFTNSGCSNSGWRKEP